MSLENPERGTGTRHKARECALQMLFAFDFVGEGHFLPAKYWSELGLEQLNRGIRQLIDDVYVTKDKIDGRLKELQNLQKKVDLPDRKHASSSIKGLGLISDAFLREFAFVLDSFANSTPIDFHPVQRKLQAMSTESQRVLQWLQGNIDHIAEENDVSTLRGIQEGLQTALDGLAARLCPGVESTLRALTPFRDFANGLVSGTLEHLAAIDDRIRTRAEHWRIERMAIVDRNVLRLAVYEFLYRDTPNPVAINEALEITRRFSSFEATQFINGVLDSIKKDLEAETPTENVAGASNASSS